MPRTLPSRRARALRPPAVGIIAAALVFAGIAVLLVTGIWAGSLGAPPSWAFDCNDTTCTDLWADARSHYLWTMAGAGLATLLGAALGGLALPRTAVPRHPGPPHPGRRGPDPSRPIPHRGVGTLIGPLLLASAVLTGAGWSALSLSRPFGLGVALLGLLLALFAAWRWLRPGARSDREAYVSAALGTIAPILACGVLALHPLGLLALIVLLGTFWLGVPALAMVLLLGTVAMDRLLPRTEADGSQDAHPPPPSAAVPSRHWSRLATSIAVGAVLVLAVLAALPVDAPSADAWKYADSSDFDFAGPADQAADQAPGTGGPSGADRPTGAGGDDRGRRRTRLHRRRCFPVRVRDRGRGPAAVPSTVTAAGRRRMGRRHRQLDCGPAGHQRRRHLLRSEGHARADPDPGRRGDRAAARAPRSPRARGGGARRDRPRPRELRTLTPVLARVQDRR